MKIPRFADKLESLLRLKNLTQAKLATKMNITERHLSRVKKGVEIPEIFIRKLCQALDVNMDYFINFQSVNDDYYPVPFRKAGGSMGCGYTDGSKKVISHISLRKDFLLVKTSNLNALSFIHASGESMSPTIPPDASVLIDESQKEPINHKIYYIQLNGLYYIKRVEVKNGRLISLISDNTGEKQKLDESDYVEILGRVIMQISEL